MQQKERRGCRKLMPLLYMMIELFLVTEILYIIGVVIGLELSYMVLMGILLAAFLFYSLSKTFRIYERMKVYCF